jgi:hypothetical protein
MAIEFITDYIIAKSNGQVTRANVLPGYPKSIQHGHNSTTKTSSGQGQGDTATAFDTDIQLGSYTIKAQQEITAEVKRRAIGKVQYPNEDMYVIINPNLKECIIFGPEKSTALTDKHRALKHIGLWHTRVEQFAGNKTLLSMANNSTTSGKSILDPAQRAQLIGPMQGVLHDMSMYTTMNGNIAHKANKAVFATGSSTFETGRTELAKHLLPKTGGAPLLDVNGDSLNTVSDITDYISTMQSSFWNSKSVWTFHTFTGEDYSLLPLINTKPANQTVQFQEYSNAWASCNNNYKNYLTQAAREYTLDSNGQIVPIAGVVPQTSLPGQSLTGNRQTFAQNIFKKFLSLNNPKKFPKPVYGTINRPKPLHQIQQPYIKGESYQVISGANAGYVLRVNHNGPIGNTINPLFGQAVTGLFAKAINPTRPTRSGQQTVLISDLAQPKNISAHMDPFDNTRTVGDSWNGSKIKTITKAISGDFIVQLANDVEITYDASNTPIKIGLVGKTPVLSPSPKPKKSPKVNVKKVTPPIITPPKKASTKIASATIVSHNDARNDRINEYEITASPKPLSGLVNAAFHGKRGKFTSRNTFKFSDTGKTITKKKDQFYPDDYVYKLVPGTVTESIIITNNNLLKIIKSIL